MIRRFIVIAALFAAAFVFVSCKSNPDAKQQQGGDPQQQGGDPQQQDGEPQVQKPDGVLSGDFSVSDTSKVKFAKGNLFWDGTKFDMESNQYDYRTFNGLTAVADGTAGSTSANNVGLFYWSKDVSKTITEFYNDDNVTAADVLAFANGGAISDLDVLTRAEWVYLTGNNEKRTGKYGLATITGINGGNGVTGLVLLPDAWTTPGTCEFTAGKSDGYSTNSYTTDQWTQMETAGAVFLPASSYRNTFNSTNHNWEGPLELKYPGEGYYLSASLSGDSVENASNLRFASTALTAVYIGRRCGSSVRLVWRGTSN